MLVVRGGLKRAWLVAGALTLFMCGCGSAADVEPATPAEALVDRALAVWSVHVDADAAEVYDDRVWWRTFNGQLIIGLEDVAAAAADERKSGSSSTRVTDTIVPATGAGDVFTLIGVGHRAGDQDPQTLEAHLFAQSEGKVRGHWRLTVPFAPAGDYESGGGAGEVELLTRFYEIVNTRNVAALSDVLDADVAVHWRAAAEPEGITSIADTVRAYRSHATTFTIVGTPMLVTEVGSGRRFGIVLSTASGKGDPPAAFEVSVFEIDDDKIVAWATANPGPLPG